MSKPEFDVVVRVGGVLGQRGQIDVVIGLVALRIVEQRRITRLVDIAEYKRRQSPPGVRVSRKAFGKDRRLPITSGYRG